MRGSNLRFVGNGFRFGKVGIIQRIVAPPIIEVRVINNIGVVHEEGSVR
jgi:hypothetical protein